MGQSGKPLLLFIVISQKGWVPTSPQGWAGGKKCKESPLDSAKVATWPKMAMCIVVACTFQQPASTDSLWTTWNTTNLQPTMKQTITGTCKQLLHCCDTRCVAQCSAFIQLHKHANNCCVVVLHAVLRNALHSYNYRNMQTTVALLCYTLRCAMHCVHTSKWLHTYNITMYYLRYPPPVGIWEPPNCLLQQRLSYPPPVGIWVPPNCFVNNKG